MTNYNHKKIAQEIRNKITDGRRKDISTDEIAKYAKVRVSENSLNDWLIKTWFNKISGGTSDSWLKNFSYWHDNKNMRLAFIKVFGININKK